MNNPGQQRWLALGLLLLVIGVLFAAVIAPLLKAGLNYREERDELLFRLQRQQKIAARGPSVAENLAAMQQQALQQQYFSAHSTEALASADLQNIVKTAIAEAGGQLTSTQGLPLASPDKQFSRVAVKVRMTGSLETLRSVLHRIESIEQLLIVDQLDILPVRGIRNRITNKIEANSQMNVGFQVISFMRAKQP